MPATVELSIVIRAPPERVFEFRRDLTNLPRYNPDVVGLRREGDAYHFRVKVLPGFAFETVLTVREATPPARLVFAITSLVDAVETCTFERVEGGTRVRFETRILSPSGIFGMLFDRIFAVPAARRQSAAELERIKEILEQG